MDDKENKRKYPRYETKIKIYFDIDYDVQTKVEYQVVDNEEKGASNGKNAIIPRIKLKIKLIVEY